MLWDEMPNGIGYEEPEMMEQTILSSKWNQNCDNAWQLDVEPCNNDSDSDNGSYRKYSD